MIYRNPAGFSVLAQAGIRIMENAVTEIPGNLYSSQIVH